ncbi:DUF4328 domain-containing protein [Roseimaritima ulvae]|uniref:DUF4328 domain-containing protein n=1 Tax=Roseimaritima ulvae TaxID=980254 RepID=A0A5B9QUN3_9BACT|nr:DUF4328 domain-containing protein [Roseimaritima ulvae]QEG42757.1 hypothetical protein UC8_47990 [Roseimaritima ulvae]
MPPENPYAAPQSLDADPNSPPSIVTSAARSLHEFRSPDKLYTAAKVLLIIYCIILALSVVSSFMQLSLLQEAADEPGPNFDSRATANDIREQFVGVTQILWFLVTGIVCLTLLRRLRWNVDTLGAKGLDSSPGWSIGWFFVPIANLWKPYQATAQTWQASVNPSDWRRAATPWLFPVWWVLWIIDGFVDRFSNRIPLDTLPQLIIATWMDVASLALTLVLTGCFIKLLSETTSAQIETHQRLSSEAEQLVAENPWTGTAGTPPALESRL